MPENKPNLLQLALGAGVLAFGLLLYIFDRNFIPIFAVPADTFVSFRLQVLGSMSGYVPSFLHALAFCLLCAGIVGADLRTAAWICASWGGVHAFFEIVQNDHVFFSIFLNLIEKYQTYYFVQLFKNYSVNGIFDLKDLLAAIAGCLAAYAAVALTRVRHEKQAHR